MTDDEISEGSAPGRARSSASPRPASYSSVEQPNHLETVVAEVEVDGEPHLVKLSRYHDNQQFWTVPGELDERLRGRHTSPSPTPSLTSTSSTT